MKILQVNAVYKIASTGRNVYELHSEMEANGIDSYVAATHLATVEDKCYQIGSIIDWKIHGLLSRLSGLQGYYSINATRRLLQYIEKIHPDVVHLNNLHANYINLPMLFKYLALNDVATVITLHDCWFYTAKCTHYTSRKCYKWKSGCHDCQALKSDNISWLFDMTPKMWEDKKKWYEMIPRLAVVGVSDWILNETAQSILSTAKIKKRIYNWIDLDVFKYSNCELERHKKFLENKYIILGVASIWDERKGLDTFIELSKELKTDEVIVLVGKVSQDLPRGIINIPVTNNVDELVKYYSMADVFLQLSEQESFGKVVAEALACGNPIVTVNSTANSELVPKNCGIVMDKLSINLIRASIDQIKRNGKLYYMDYCRKFAEENFDIQKCCGEYIELYQQLLEITEEKGDVK